jgi:hypothetical protein
MARNQHVGLWVFWMAVSQFGSFPLHIGPSLLLAPSFVPEVLTDQLATLYISFSEAPPTFPDRQPFDELMVKMRKQIPGNNNSKYYQLQVYLRCGKFRYNNVISPRAAESYEHI